MSWLRFTFDSVSSFAPFLMSLVITFALLRVRVQRISHWLFATFFTLTTLYTFLIFVQVSLDAREQALLSPPILLLTLLGYLFQIQFAYRFPRPVYLREARWVLGASSLLVLLGVAATVRYYSLALTGGEPRQALALLSLFCLLQYGWGLLLRTRQIATFSAEASGERVTWRTLWRHFLLPHGRDAQGARLFALTVLIALSVFAVNLLWHSGVLPNPGLHRFVVNLGLLTVIYLLGLIYLNYASETSTFMVKLLLSTLVSVLAVLGLGGHVMKPLSEAAYDQVRLAEAGQVLVQLQNGQPLRADWLPPSVSLVVAQPSGALLFARDPERALAALEGDVLRQNGSIADGIRLEVGSDETTKTSYTFYSLTLEGQRYGVGFDYETLRAYRHEQATPLLGLTLGATFFILLLFPAFFRVNLVQPLTNLLEGVRQVNEGRRDIVVPVRYADEIGFLTESFNHMVASLRRTDELKDQFLANTSHELRTPLNGIIGLADSMLDGATGSLSEAQAHNLSLIVTSGKRLASLVNDILDFSRLRHHDLQLQLNPLDVRALTDTVLLLSRPLMGNKALELINRIPPDLPLALADENRVGQILHNLVGNAIKFTEAGRVEISAVALVDQLVITVADTGIGIAADQLNRIFEEFQQVDGSTAREYGGTGLGLSISKKLVELHGGTIALHSVVGEGTRIAFSLPRAAEEHGTAAAPQVAPEESLSRLQEASTALPAPSVPVAEEGRFHILIVDDEPVNLQVLHNHLSLHGYRVTQALSGFEALSLVEQGLRPDLIVLDVMMPRMSGYQFCQKVREKLAPAEVPVIMLTARNQVSDLVTGLDVGANDYMVKPFSKYELLARVKMHLHVSQINNAYARFVPREFLQQLGQESIVDVRLGEQVQKEMTIMFADVRSFTALSEQMSPQENFEFINALLGDLGPLVRQHGGFIDKYIGDALMALFPGQADDALRAGIAMRRGLTRFNQLRSARGHPPIQIGIGMHSGLLTLGTVGEAQRMEGTVISDAVNIASRLEALAKQHQAFLLLSEDTLNRLADPSAYHYRPLGQLELRGKHQRIRVFEVFDGDDLVRLRLKQRTQPTFEHALALYRQQRFTEATLLFEQVLQEDPFDSATRLYVARARRFAQPDEVEATLD